MTWAGRSANLVRASGAAIRGSVREMPRTYESARTRHCAICNAYTWPTVGFGISGRGLARLSEFRHLKTISTPIRRHGTGWSAKSAPKADPLVLDLPALKATFDPDSNECSVNLGICQDRADQRGRTWLKAAAKNRRPALGWACATDVFISYASQDAAVANAVVVAIERDGMKCWIAP